MAWIESHQGLAKHPKTLKMARKLDITIAQVIGHLHLFWWWAMDYAQDGDLSHCDPEDIAIAADWVRDPDEFITTMCEVGFIDQEIECLVIHDWYDYAGRLIEKKEANKERMRSARAKKEHERATHVQRTNNARATNVQGLPYLTLPNHIKEKDIVPFGDIITYLNEKTGQSYRASTKATQSHINARWKEGYRLNDFIRVIDSKVAEWGRDPKFRQYLRPETLFGTKFESYLNAKPQQQEPLQPVDKALEARWREIAFNKWIASGGDPSEFVYRPTAH